MSPNPEEAAVTLNAETESLFASAREGLAPTEADRARNFAALVDRLGPAAVQASIPKARANGAGAMRGASTFAKAVLLGLAVMVVGAALLGVFLAMRPSKRIEPGSSRDVATGVAKTAAVETPLGGAHEERAEAPMGPSTEPPTPSSESTSIANDQAPAPPPTPATSLPTPAMPPSTSAKPAVKRSDARAATTSPGSAPDPTTRKPWLREEVDLVSRMQAALQSGNADRVHALAREHAQRFPEGVLAPEVFATDTMASCAASPKSADAELQRFESRFPHSPLRARVRSACAK